MLNIWRKWYTMRRYNPQTIVDGYPVSTYTTKRILVDVQPDQNMSSIDIDGKRRVTRVTTYGNAEVRTDNVETGQKADWLLFEGEWYMCETSMWYEHTPLAHYTATWVRVPEGADK